MGNGLHKFLIQGVIDQTVPDLFDWEKDLRSSNDAPSFSGIELNFMFYFFNAKLKSVRMIFLIFFTRVSDFKKTC